MQSDLALPTPSSHLDIPKHDNGGKFQKCKVTYFYAKGKGHEVQKINKQIAKYTSHCQTNRLK